MSKNGQELLIRIDERVGTLLLRMDNLDNQLTQIVMEVNAKTDRTDFEKHLEWGNVQLEQTKKFQSEITLWQNVVNGRFKLVVGFASLVGTVIGGIIGFGIDFVRELFLRK